MEVPRQMLQLTDPLSAILQAGENTLAVSNVLAMRESRLLKISDVSVHFWTALLLLIV